MTLRVHICICIYVHTCTYISIYMYIYIYNNNIHIVPWNRFSSTCIRSIMRRKPVLIRACGKYIRHVTTRRRIMCAVSCIVLWSFAFICNAYIYILAPEVVYIEKKMDTQPGKEGRCGLKASWCAFLCMRRAPLV